MKRGEVTFRENGTQLAVKWQDKRDVNFLTTVHPLFHGSIGKVGPLHRGAKEERMPYKDFRLKLVKELIQEHPLPRRSTGGRPCINTPPAAHREALSLFCASYRSPGTEHKAALQSLPLHTTRRKRERKLSRYMCSSCDTALCPAPCFEEFHTLKNSRPGGWGM
ncbi:hypothetical protein SKAU_G00093230 [Synaphobranchus kaupii]|uniref:PiggyBac transposable element-derived protein 4 C-terminal zinc-finger domain-containing protein n=1 Tax=Synaphobranchus kaupii TaxID=118154 RepID=A0A9Q1FXZ8_SYNKA|nr:hypothetical protein SKAU_G00093230 [Synaphobranchus kaupii]